MQCTWRAVCTQVHYARVVYRTSPHVDLTDHQHYPPIVYRYAQTLQYTVGVQNVRGVELTAPYVHYNLLHVTCIIIRVLCIMLVQREMQESCIPIHDRWRMLIVCKIHMWWSPVHDSCIMHLCANCTSRALHCTTGGIFELSAWYVGVFSKKNFDLGFFHNALSFGMRTKKIGDLPPEVT